ncbi:MAG: shikimate 5-dehydrogenase [Myxococcales bacterium]|nr:shikimate 5-dehydrogenase [Myxococcales bacterium]
MTTIRGATRLAAVLGWPIEHSRSPQILNAAFAASGIDAVLVPIGVPPHGLAAAMGGLRAMQALGASVTIPHKLAVAALCDELSPAARTIGAVNCLHIDGDHLIGHNTDEGGFSDGLLAAGFELRGARAVILGAGGAARAVAHGLRGGRAIEVVARRPAEVTWAPAWPWDDDHLRDAFRRADLVVDCTSIGLGGADEEAATDALPLDALPAKAWVSTLVYHRQTRLLQRARELGYSTLDGKAMLVHQAARAFTIWTGSPAPIEIMTRALDDDLRGT